MSGRLLSSRRGKHEAVSDEVRSDELPTWAAWARIILRGLVVIYALSWLVMGALKLSNLVFGTHLLESNTSVWPNVAFGAFLGVGAICGLLWLAGEVMSGYREPESPSR